MNYMNKPIKPSKEDFPKAEDLIAAFENYYNAREKYDDQWDALAKEFDEVTELAETVMESDPELFKKLADRMDEINEIREKARNRLLVEENPTTKVPTTPKKPTKTVLMTFRVEEELRDEFTSYCAQRNISVSSLIRDLMKFELRPSNNEKLN